MRGKRICERCKVRSHLLLATRPTRRHSTHGQMPTRAWGMLRCIWQTESKIQSGGSPTGQKRSPGMRRVFAFGVLSQIGGSSAPMGSTPAIQRRSRVTLLLAKQFLQNGRPHATHDSEALRKLHNFIKTLKPEEIYADNHENRENLRANTSSRDPRSSEVIAGSRCHRTTRPNMTGYGISLRSSMLRFWLSV